MHLRVQRQSLAHNHYRDPTALRSASRSRVAGLPTLMRIDRERTDVIQQTIRTEHSRRHLITLGIWPTPFVAFASSTSRGNRRDEPENASRQQDVAQLMNTKFYGRTRGMARTAVTRVPTSVISGRGYSAGRTAAGRTAAGRARRCGRWPPE